MVQNIPINEKLPYLRWFEWHVGVCRNGYESDPRGLSYGTNVGGENILNFALIQFLVANTWFKKRDRTRENAT